VVILTFAYFINNPVQECKGTAILQNTVLATVSEALILQNFIISPHSLALVPQKPPSLLICTVLWGIPKDSYDIDDSKIVTKLQTNDAFNAGFLIW
jgi:hypothetical protein